MAEGRGDTPEANRLRALSEKPWYAMTEAEQNLVNGLSADLYDLSPDTLGPERTSISVSEFSQLLYARRWAEALHYLRENKTLIRRSELASHRGGIWAQLSEDQAAFEFYHYAYLTGDRLSESGLILFLQAAISVRAFAAVKDLAESLFGSDNPPPLRLMAVQWQFARTMIESDEMDDAITRRLISTIEAALENLSTSERPEHLRLMIRNALVTVACCHSNLGDFGKAHFALDRVLAEYPNDEIASHMKALLNFESTNGSSQARSAQDRRHAVRVFALTKIIPTISIGMPMAA
jgi:hypothetical protein